ncbi:MAG TPA: hypothetical protein VIS48_03915 [Candidatus Kryptonia bacterium]
MGLKKIVFRINFVITMFPTIISELFPDAHLGSVPLEVEKILEKIVNEVK